MRRYVGSVGSVLAGALIAVMVMANGQLSGAAGLWGSLAWIHALGLLAIGAVWLVRRLRFGAETPFFRAARGLSPLWMTSGLIGIVTTLCNNAAYPHISISVMLAVSLLGQSALSLLIDLYGWFGVPRVRVRAGSVAGLAVICVGIALMMTLQPADARVVTGDTAWAVALSVLCGATTVLSRMVAAQLSRRVGVVRATVCNYVTGLLFSFALCAAFGTALIAPVAPLFALNPFALSGGVLGTVIVLISVALATRMSSFLLTVLMFLGQAAGAAALDAALAGAFSAGTLIGSAVVAAGLWCYARSARAATQGSNRVIAYDKIHNPVLYITHILH